MRLLTHNMLHSAHKRGVQKGYPLGIDVEKKEIIKQEMNEMFIKDRLVKLDWNCFLTGCQSVGIADIPPTLDTNLLDDKDFLSKCHHALLEIHVLEGNLICPETNRKFPIKDGIPDMLLREDELPSINESDLRCVETKQDDNNTDKKEATKDENNINTKETEATTQSGDKESGNNPYLDPSLMQGLQQFSPKQNEEFITSHKVDPQQQKETSTDNNDDNDTLMKQ
eukprot:153277_1